MKNIFFAFLFGIGSLFNIAPAAAKSELGTPADDTEALRRDVAMLGEGLHSGIKAVSNDGK